MDKNEAYIVRMILTALFVGLAQGKAGSDLAVVLVVGLLVGLAFLGIGRMIDKLEEHWKKNRSRCGITGSYLPGGASILASTPCELRKGHWGSHKAGGLRWKG